MREPGVRAGGDRLNPEGTGEGGAALSSFEPQLLAELTGELSYLRTSGEHLFWIRNAFDGAYIDTVGVDRMLASGGDVERVVVNAQVFTVSADAIYVQPWADFSIRKYALDGTALERTDPHAYCGELISNDGEVYCVRGEGVLRVTPTGYWSPVGVSNSYMAMGGAVFGDYVYWSAAELLRAPIAGGETQVLAQTWSVSGFTIFEDMILFTESPGAQQAPAVITAMSETGRNSFDFTPVGGAYAVDLAVVEPWVYAVDGQSRELLRFALPGSDAPAPTARAALATGVAEVESDGDTLYYVAVDRPPLGAPTSRLFAVRRR